MCTKIKGINDVVARTVSQKRRERRWSQYVLTSMVWTSSRSERNATAGTFCHQTSAGTVSPDGRGWRGSDLEARRDAAATTGRRENVLLLLLLLLNFAMVLLKLLISEVFLVLERLPLVPGDLVFRVFKDVFDFFAGKSNGSA